MTAQDPPISAPVFLIEVDKIAPNPEQPRREFDEVSLRELAASIREVGLLQPIIVSKLEKETEMGTEVSYVLIAGERRWRAASLAGLERIPAIIRDVKLERERLELALVENVQRADLNPIEEAKAYTRLQEEFRLTQREVAVKVGKSREAVANTMRLLSLPSEIQEAVAARRITESQARLLLSVSDIPAQKQLFNDILLNNLSVREIKIRVDAHKKAKQPVLTPDVSAGASGPPDPEALALQKELEAMLGAPVKVERTDGQAKIVIQCFSPEELEGLLARLRGTRRTDRSDQTDQTDPSTEDFTV